MAMLTGVFEGFMMGIQVTRGASRELHVLEARGPTRHVWFMAFFAGHLDMQAGKRVTGFGVIELLRCFPIAGIVTARTVRAKLALVVVLVTANTLLRQPQVRLIQIFILDQTAFRRCDIVGSVAFPAFDLRVLAVQRVPGQLVIKLLDGSIPVYQGESESVVFQVTTDAVLARRILHLETCVIPVFLRKRLGNLFVTIEALEDGGFRSELMATRALGGSC
jgi:hypothetical protein